MIVQLPPVTPFRKVATHDNAWADHYGALQVAAKYAGVQMPDGARILGGWQHGVFGPWIHHSPRMLAYNAPGSEQRPLWVAREDQAELLRANGFLHARAVGMPILYAPGGGLERTPGSLLIMPGHTLGGWVPTDRSAFQRYADEIAEVAKDFSQVRVCISPRCLRTGLWVKEFRSRGIEVLEGADTADANALQRVRMLMEQFETVTTNCWGSHVAYALALGARVSIYGTVPQVDPEAILRLDRAWAAEPGALARARSPESRREQDEFLAPLRLVATAAVTNPALGEWLIGHDRKLTGDEMREALPTMVGMPQRAPITGGADWSRVSLAPTRQASPQAESEPGSLPVVLFRSHEFNYSETFVEDHVNHLTRNLTLVYGCPFPRFLKGGKSVLTETLEAKLAQAITSRAITVELWSAYSRELAQFLKGSGADAALVESGLMGSFVHAACEQAALPYVVHFHGVDAFGKELLAQWGAHYRRFFKAAAGVVAVSRAMRRQLISLGARSEQVVLGPYGVAVNLPALAEPANAPPQFLAVGRFVEKKAPYATLQAFSLVHRHIPEARLVMVGDGPLLEACRNLAAKNGVADAVTFLGVQSRETVSRLMAASRAFVQHSVTADNGDSEGLPLAILEAGAHGLPVVSTLHAGIPDAVRDGVDGLLVPEKDIKGMAASMHLLAQDADLAARLGASFRERVQTNYSRRRSLERLLAVLQAAASGQPMDGLGDEDRESTEPTPHYSTVEAPVAGSPATSETNVSSQSPAAVDSPDDVHAAIAADRNDREAYLKLARELADKGDIAGAYTAAGEARRLCKDLSDTEGLLQSLEDQGALGEPIVESYRRRVGWLPRRKNNRPRRILVVTNLLPPQEMGGFGRTMSEFGRELVARGHQVRVLTADMPHLLRKKSAEHEAFEPNVRRTLKLFGDWREGAAVLEPDRDRLLSIAAENHHAVLVEARSFRPDAVIAGNLDLLGYSFLQELLDKGVPVLHRLGNAHPGYAAADAPDSPLYRMAGGSEWTNVQLREKGYSKLRYAVLPPGSTLDGYYRAFPPRRDRLRIAYASLLMPYKGAHVLIDALLHLKRAGIDFSCTLAGETTSAEYVEQLKQFATEHGFSGQLEFAGFLGEDELGALFARSNVLVFPTVGDEVFGKTQIEAMAAGLLVISSGNGGAREIIRDGKTGLYFPSGDARALAERLAQVHQQPELAAKVAAAGQADAFRFTTGASVDKLESLLEELIAAARKPAARAVARVR